MSKSKSDRTDYDSDQRRHGQMQVYIKISFYNLWCSFQTNVPTYSTIIMQCECVFVHNRIYIRYLKKKKRKKKRENGRERNLLNKKFVCAFYIFFSFREYCFFFVAIIYIVILCICERGYMFDLHGKSEWNYCLGSWIIFEIDLAWTRRWEAQVVRFLFCFKDNIKRTVWDTRDRDMLNFMLFFLCILYKYLGNLLLVNHHLSLIKKRTCFKEIMDCDLWFVGMNLQRDL